MDEGGIYTSTNGGTSWTQTAAPISIYWRSIASSSDGSKLAAVYTDYEDYIQRGRVYTSTDRGISWTHQTAMWLNRYKEIASSSDGSMLAVDTGGDGVIWMAVTRGLILTRCMQLGLPAPLMVQCFSLLIPMVGSKPATMVASHGDTLLIPLLVEIVLQSPPLLMAQSWLLLLTDLIITFLIRASISAPMVASIGLGAG